MTVAAAALLDPIQDPSATPRPTAPSRAREARRTCTRATPSFLGAPGCGGVPVLDLLELQAAARIFRYSGFDANWTWKLGARWRPIRDVTLRGTLSTAFRAPSVRELYFGSASLAGIVQDPCSGVDDMGEPVPVSPRCGPLAGNVEPFPVVTFEDHGNRSLSPETARVFTAGLVLEPRFARELTLTFDAYGVAIDRVIQSNGDPVGQCYPMAADARPQFCQYVERDPATHALTRVVTTPVNVGNERMWVWTCPSDTGSSPRSAASACASKGHTSGNTTWSSRMAR